MMIRTTCGLAIAAALVAGCQQGKPAGGTVEPRAAWARATAPGQESGGVFLTLDNKGDQPDRLVAGATPVAASVEIHTMNMHGTIMRMEQQKLVDVPAGATVKLEPGGTHLMLVGLKSPLKVGQSFPLTLDFARAGHKQVEVKVRPIGSMGPKDGGDE